MVIYENDLECVKQGTVLLEKDVEEEEDDEGEENTEPGPAYLVKLVDSAHTKPVA